METPIRRDIELSRFLRTDFYFQEPGRLHQEDSSLSVVFLKDEPKIAPETSGRPSLVILPIDQTAITEIAINAIVQPRYSPEQLQRTFQTISALSHEISQQSIITERSPPVAIILSKLLTQSHWVVGMLAGTNISPDPVIAMASIAGGTIVMGAAVGISTGLQKGLAEVVKDWITTHFGRRIAKKRTSKRKKPAGKAKANRRRSRA